MNKKLIYGLFAVCLVAALCTTASAVVLPYLMRSNEVSVSVEANHNTLTLQVFKYFKHGWSGESIAVLKLVAVCSDGSFNGVVSFWCKPVIVCHDGSACPDGSVLIANVTAVNGVAKYTWCPSPGSYTVYATATYNYSED